MLALFTFAYFVNLLFLKPGERPTSSGYLRQRQEAIEMQWNNQSLQKSVPGWHLSAWPSHYVSLVSFSTPLHLSFLTSKMGIEGSPDFRASTSIPTQCSQSQG